MAKRIMIVDDSATVRKFVAASLTMQGFTVVAACDGMDALEQLPSGTLDLVITDLNMPNMDGFEFIRALRDNPLTRDVPVIILSSLGDRDSMAAGRELGVRSYLMKPFSLEKIQYEVSKYISWAD